MIRRFLLGLLLAPIVWASAPLVAQVIRALN